MYILRDGIPTEVSKRIIRLTKKFNHDCTEAFCNKRCNL